MKFFPGGGSVSPVAEALKMYLFSEVGEVVVEPVEILSNPRLFPTAYSQYRRLSLTHRLPYCSCDLPCKTPVNLQRLVSVVIDGW